MYISIERNAKGNLEIDDSVINQQVEYIVASKVSGVSSIKSCFNIHNENELLIIIRFKITDRKEFEHGYNMSVVEEQISETINATLSLKPKSVSFAFIH